MKREKGAEAITEKHRIDELLELILTMEERGETTLNRILESSEEDNPAVTLGEMEKKGMVKINENQVTLTETGRKMAREIVRRHRLAEMLLSEVFKIDDRFIDSEACKFEHILSPEVTDSVCAFLGHPPVCPHGNPIPKGECCTKFKRDFKPLVVPLRDLQPGDEGRIVFIAPKEHARLDRLVALGVVPGSIIRLHQKDPSYVIRIGETELAIDEEIAKEIYVKKV